ncbi:MAG: dihydroorotate dehydrogenase electron transfer subunit [gamma proteobacterium symbiont of Bathyaustriella thionipta]|nr:dihydroorotate dehydrogenase electron transfer subunit [gamma proteobacterium symbiont of Bathyaustriella thionipta]
MHKSYREPIKLEQASVISQHHFDGEQHILRLHSPRCAQAAKAGQFVHLTVGPELALRRPISIMLADARQGYIDLLYKVVGSGTRILSQRRPGDSISLLGPVGKPFSVSQGTRLPLLIGGGVGMPPMIFLAHELRQHKQLQPFVILGSEVAFPFDLEPSQHLVDGLPDGVIACMPLLQQWGIPSRLASRQGFAGCHDGFVTDLARNWLDTLTADSLKQVELFSCGPEPMLQAVAQLAADYDLPCQLSLEEYMACAVGGCAGCTVAVTSQQQTRMQRVCVDGPVFAARQIYPDLFTTRQVNQ